MLYSTHALHTCEVRNSTVEQSLCCFPSSVSALIAANYLEDGTTHLDTGLVARAVQKSRFSLDLVQCTLHLQTYLLILAALLPPGKREHTPGLPIIHTPGSKRSYQNVSLQTSVECADIDSNIDVD